MCFGRVWRLCCGRTVSGLETSLSGTISGTMESGSSHGKRGASPGGAVVTFFA